VFETEATHKTLSDRRPRQVAYQQDEEKTMSKSHSEPTKFGKLSLDELHLLGVCLSSAESAANKFVSEIASPLAGKEYWIYTRARYSALLKGVQEELSLRKSA
jgi:hypothetical protein